MQDPRPLNKSVLGLKAGGIQILCTQVLAVKSYRKLLQNKATEISQLRLE